MQRETLLLIHDQNDRQIPVAESARTAHALPGAELMVTLDLNPAGAGKAPSLISPGVTPAFVLDALRRGVLEGPGVNYVSVLMEA